MEDKQKMAKNMWIVIATLLILGAGAFVFINSEKVISGAVVGTGGESQRITLSFKDGNYYPNVITAKVGQPVSIMLDDSVKGCYRGFVIRDLGISKNSKSPSDTIDFTPAKTGTYRFACSMGMGMGTLIVTETGQASSAQIDAAKTASSSTGGTCGASSGCGCGSYS